MGLVQQHHMREMFWIQLSKGFVFIMMMMTSPFFVWGQSTPSQHEALLVQADTLLNREDYAGALTLYNQVIEKSKLASDADYTVLYKRAVCYYGLRQFEEALGDVNAVLSKYPNEQAKLLRAYINQELGNESAQLADLNELLSLNPDNPELLYWRASVLMESEKYAKARNDIRKLLSYQSNPELKAYLGLSYYYQNNIDSALMIFDEAIAEDSTYVQAYIYAASLCMDEEAYELSLSYINRGFQVDPSNKTLLFYKGIALAENDQLEEGCRCLTKAFKSGMDDVADYLKQYCYGGEE